MKLPFRKHKRRPTIFTQVRSHIALADKKRDARQWDLAKESYAEALKLDGSLAHIWVQYGHSLKESGDPAAALKAYEAAYKLKPSEADTALQIAHCVKMLGNTEKAKSWYLRALELDIWDSHAEHELKFLKVPIDLYIPDIEKRRVRCQPYSLSDRPIFFLVPGEDFRACDTKAASRVKFHSEILQCEGEQALLGTCQISSDGKLIARRFGKGVDGIITAQAGSDLPKGAVLISHIDMLIESAGTSALLLELSRSHDVVPVLFIDKTASDETAASLISGKSAEYVAARSASLLTLAVDSRSVDRLDSVASARKYSLSPVREILRSSPGNSSSQAGSSGVAIVCRDLQADALVKLLSHLRDKGDDITLIAENLPAAERDPAIGGGKMVCNAYSVEGLSAIESARAVIVMDDCVDAHLWARTARKHLRPLLLGLAHANARLWGHEILDFVDFSDTRSISRIARVLEELKTDEQSSLKQKDLAKAATFNWSALNSLSWEGRDGFAAVQPGEFYAFGSSPSFNHAQNFQSAERFEYGSTWLQDAPDNGLEVEWVLAGRITQSKHGLPIMRILIWNDLEITSTVAWNSGDRREQLDLPPARQMWIDVVGEKADETASGTFIFKWRGSAAGARPLGVVVTLAEQSASWSGFLDRMQEGAYSQLL